MTELRPKAFGDRVVWEGKPLEFREITPEQRPFTCVRFCAQGQGRCVGLSCYLEDGNGGWRSGYYVEVEEQ